MPPELGKTASEVVSVIEPLLREMVTKEEYLQQTGEIAGLRAEMKEMNGTVRGLCTWRAAIDERHRHEDVKPHCNETSGSRADTLGIVKMVFDWSWKIVLASGLLAGAIRLPELIELLPK